MDLYSGQRLKQQDPAIGSCFDYPLKSNFNFDSSVICVSIWCIFSFICTKVDTIIN